MITNTISQNDSNIDLGDVWQSLREGARPQKYTPFFAKNDENDMTADTNLNDESDQSIDTTNKRFFRNPHKRIKRGQLKNTEDLKCAIEEAPTAGAVLYFLKNEQFFDLLDISIFNLAMIECNKSWCLNIANALFDNENLLNDDFNNNNNSPIKPNIEFYQLFFERMALTNRIHIAYPKYYDRMIGQDNLKPNSIIAAHLLQGCIRIQSKYDNQQRKLPKHRDKEHDITSNYPFAHEIFYDVIKPHQIQFDSEIYWRIMTIYANNKRTVYFAQKLFAMLLEKDKNVNANTNTNGKMIENAKYTNENIAIETNDVLEYITNNMNSNIKIEKRHFDIILKGVSLHDSVDVIMDKIEYYCNLATETYGFELTIRNGCDIMYGCNENRLFIQILYIFDKYVADKLSNDGEDDNVFLKHKIYALKQRAHLVILQHYDLYKSKYENSKSEIVNLFQSRKDHFDQILKMTKLMKKQGTLKRYEYRSDDPGDVVSTMFGALLTYFPMSEWNDLKLIEMAEEWIDEFELIYWYKDELTHEWRIDLRSISNYLQLIFVVRYIFYKDKEILLAASKKQQYTLMIDIGTDKHDPNNSEYHHKSTRTGLVINELKSWEPHPIEAIIDQDDDYSRLVITHENISSFYQSCFNDTNFVDLRCILNQPSDNLTYFESYL